MKRKGLRQSSKWKGLGLLSGLSILLMAPYYQLFASPLKSDEEVIFFPQSARWDSEQEVWRIPVHGWVFESELDSLWRRFTVASAATMLGIEEVDDEGIFRKRVWPFLVDNERNKVITVRYPEGGEFTLNVSAANGHFTGEFSVGEEALEQEKGAPWLQFDIAMPEGDARRFQGEAQLLCPKGVSVISDLDDTIKISNVLDKKALLANTFLREFSAVPGMSSVYRQWHDQGMAFHYVSGSPWQLYPSLGSFLMQSGFPKGSFHLRSFRLKDSSFLNLFASAEEFKIPAIDAILKAYPQRSFVLVGDSGEKDPEVYGEMARRYPDQVAAVMIRNITNETKENVRMQEAFRDVPASQVVLFSEAEELERFSIEIKGFSREARVCVTGENANEINSSKKPSLG